MNCILKGSFAAVAILALGTVAVPASARSVPASAGRADFASNAACYDVVRGTISNHCASASWFTIPVVIDPNTFNGISLPTKFTVTVTGFAPWGASLNCSAEGVNPDGITLNGGPAVNIPTHGTHGVAWTLHPAILPVLGSTVGSAYVGCWMSQNTEISAINY